MRTNPDTPLDPLGNLGKAIRQDKPAPAPVPVAPGIVRNQSGNLETQIAPPAPVWHPVVTPVIVTDGQAEDWEGLGLTSYTSALLGCI